MTNTELLQLFYKVKKKQKQNKKTMINQFYKRKILITGSTIVQKVKKSQQKTPNAQQRATKTSQSMAIV